jgi:hypothetical protein
MLDKCRAEIAGTAGEYHYNCPLDQQFLAFIGLDAEKLKAEVAKGKGDGEILEWIGEHATLRRAPYEIAQWTAWREQAVPGDHESRDFLNSIHRDIAPHRADIYTWADVLDLDDYVSFGGKP